MTWVIGIFAVYSKLNERFAPLTNTTFEQRSEQHERPCKLMHIARGQLAWPLEWNKTKHKTTSTHCGSIY